METYHDLCSDFIKFIKCILTDRWEIDNNDNKVTHKVLLWFEFGLCSNF